MLITPRATEKSYKLTNENCYVFDVPLTANKAEVIAAVEAQNDGVKVRDVRLAVIKGKVKAVNRGKRSRPGHAQRRDNKKAYVAVSEGKIEIAAFTEYENQLKEQAAKDEKEAKQPETPIKSARESEKGTAEAKKAGLFAKRRTGRRGDR
jgi:ribosomal protein L23